MSKPLLVTGGIACVFILVIGIMWALMPYPRKDIDFLVIGGTATMVSMGLLFVILIKTSFKNQDIFFKRRNSGPRTKDPPQD